MKSRIKIIAGPCSAESREQVLDTAKALAKTGIYAFRAGLWKPRTRPGMFEGVGSKGLQWLSDVKKETGLKVCCEVATPEHLHQALEAGVDILWIGARTTADPFAVQALADAVKNLDKTPEALLIKNPVNPDVELWAGALERFLNAGIRQIILVHRGFSSYGNQIYRNIPLWHIPIEMKRRFPDIQMLCDPSHMGGKPQLIAPISQQALDLMYDGLMIECHINPDQALSDKAQQITPIQLEKILSHLKVRENSQNQQSLESFRSQIDSLDESLLQIISKRMDVSRQIGDFKQRNNMPVLQSKRYSEIVENRSDLAESLGLDRDFAKSLMEIIHKESVKVQLKQRNEDSNPK
ncbi:MAG: bifunctional 3-deoxy-7-phosphoheptulonate synthase/chorismate mutase type II [Bacteroidales bacterium]|nr:bifunctional 3-deoxy-7-phosphoheptulonate synthase/chorismate mutase type II [Bacteroidales bacterium]